MVLRAGLRYLWRHPWLLLLSVLGVALGVAVVTAIDLVNSSALRAFELSSRALTGAATHQIVGSTRGVPDRVYRALRLAQPALPAAPVITGYVTLDDGTVLRLLGVDVFAEAQFRDYLAVSRSTITARQRAGHAPAAIDWRAFLTTPDTVLLTTSRARRLGLQAGASLRADIGGHAHTLVLAGTFRPREAFQREALDDVMVTDIATAQTLLGMTGTASRRGSGHISHIDLILPAGVPGQAAAARLRAWLHARDAGLALVPAATRSRALGQMTGAFRLNLTALSLLALVVGGFLIYNAMTFAVLRRRTLFGTLRALGVTRGEIYRLVLVEAVLIGVAGTVLGMGLGIVLGDGLLRLVTRTINDLYFVLQVQGLSLSVLALAKAAALGVGATVLAALLPAREATRTPPRAVMSRSHLEGRMRRILPRATLAGLGLLLLGGVLLCLPSRSLVLSFAALFFVITGFALLVPALILLFVPPARALLGAVLGLVGRMAARGVATSLSRTGVAVAALTVAVAATVGMGIMIDSFRHTVAVWLQGYLRADIFVTPPGGRHGAQPVLLDPRLVARFKAVPGVQSVSIGRRVDLVSAQGLTQLFVLGIPRSSFAAFRLKAGDPRRAKQAFFDGGAALITEPYAYRHRLRVGDSVRLRTDRGEHAFPVAGIYYDYGSESGYVTLSRATYERYWDDRGITSLGIYATPAARAGPDALIDRLRRAARGIQPVVFQSNRSLRETSLAIFDRTFLITGVLRMLAIGVAFIGILSALMAIQLERARELAVLRACGLTPRQLFVMVVSETGLMGLLAGVLALPLGSLLAVLLIEVINRRAFGWSMEVLMVPGILIEAVVLSVGAALLAGLYPAWRMARTPPAQALREE